MSIQNVVDTSLLFVKQINARNPDGSLISAQKVLTSDGAGGTYWASPAGFTAEPSVNGLIFDGVPLLADSSNNYFRVLSGTGIGTSVDTAAKTVNIYSKSFQTIDVVGGNTIRSSSASPTLRLVGEGGIQLSSDPVVNTIYIRGTGGSGAGAGGTGAAGTGAGAGGPGLVSANAYSQVNVISNVRTITPGSVDSTNNSVLTASNASENLTVAGVGDVLLSTNVTRNAYFISISSFTSKGWHDLSGVAYGTLSSAMSTVSSLFTNTTQLQSTTASLASNIQRTGNLINGYTTLDLYKLNSTNTYYKIAGVNNLASSINISQHRGDLAGVYGNSIYSLSTATFRLDALSSIITNKGQVQINHAPSFSFSNNFTVSSDTLLYVSSFIRCGDQDILSTTFVRPWLLRSGSIINLYTDSLRFLLPVATINNTGMRSNYSIMHRIDNFTLVSVGGWSANPVAKALISGDNTLSLFITGSSS
jgi:hypothetical protein